MNYTEVRSFMEDILASKAGSYEFKKELTDRAVDAVKTNDVNKLFGEMVLFKPDGIREQDRLDIYSDLEVREAIKKYAIYDHVIDIIHNNVLRELLGDEFAAICAQEFMEERARKAIRIGDVTPLRMGLDVITTDGARYALSGAEAEEKFKKLGIWDYVLQEIEKKKVMEKMDKDTEEDE